jgi:glycosyltransferase involved in cell wall biosynthesis
MPPTVSIVIATYKREMLLQILLDSVLDQSVTPGNYEVVVVDNAPKPHGPTQELCRSPRYNLLDIKCVHNPVLGLSQARNYGMRYASAPWVAFIDDDEKIPLHWVERAIEIIDNYSPDFFGGPYHPIHIEAKPAWFKDKYLARTLGVKKGWLENGEMLFGGDLVIQRKWLDRLKGFSTDLGRRGNIIEYGEDNELQLRALRQGAKFYYDSDLYVFHHVLPKQITPQWFMTSAWYQGKASSKLYSGAERQGKSAVAYTLTQLKNTIAQAFFLAGVYLYTPFRNKKVVAFRENYLIESVAPAVLELGKSWNSFLLSFKKIK